MSYSKCDLCGYPVNAKQNLKVIMEYGCEVKEYTSGLTLCEKCAEDIYNKAKELLRIEGTPIFEEFEGIEEIEDIDESLEVNNESLNEEVDVPLDGEQSTNREESLVTEVLNIINEPKKKPNSNVKKKEINETDFQEIISLHDAGYNESEISKRLKIIKGVVREAIKYDSYSSYKNLESLETTVDKGKCIALFNAGWFIEDIMLELQCSRETVAEILSTMSS